MNAAELEALFTRAVSTAVLDAAIDIYKAPASSQGGGSAQQAAIPSVIDISLAQSDKMITSVSSQTVPPKDYQRLGGKIIGASGFTVSGFSMTAPVVTLPATEFYPRWIIRCKFPQPYMFDIFKSDAWKSYITSIGINLTDLFYGSPLLATVLSYITTSGPDTALFKTYATISDKIRADILVPRLSC